MPASSQDLDETEQSTGLAAWWPDASLLGVALIWGVNIPLMKIGIDQIDVYVFNAIRLTISALVLALFAFQEYGRGVVPLPGLRWWQVVIYGAMIGIAYQLVFLAGIARTSSGNTALIVATAPIWTALLARFLIGEKLQMLAWSGLLIALVGTIIVAWQKGDVTASYSHLTGNLLIVLSALLWAGGTVMSRQLLQRISPTQLAAASAAFALPVHLLVAAGKYQESLPALAAPSLCMIIIYAGVLSSGLAQPMWSFGVRHAGAAHAAIIQNLIPLVSIVVAWFVRNEVPVTAQLIGGALILGGLITMRVARRKRAVVGMLRA